MNNSLHTMVLSPLETRESAMANRKIIHMLVP